MLDADLKLRGHDPANFCSLLKNIFKFDVFIVFSDAHSLVRLK